ncbi:LysR family transcriptional regulator ArgP [Pseudooceanicola algae]|uniref:Putative HTH-type transcriptional regulator n=1 Tax=Pseudooceanicola algae TaxID=1537215 RepID=A0A418SJH0_9RHOB|nr:LysR family transcriptional regulator ArgP [Pseudooceanicola algae]QPM91897.1 putative HTH-type transcriptional regulator [Pseudooceanicola algae]
MPLDPAQLATLAAILRRGSFDRAAAELGVTQSAVSQRLRALEEQVGMVLVQRGPPATGTQAGARLAQHAEQLALLESRALHQIGQVERPGGQVSVAVNADSLATWFPEALARAQDSAPGLQFNLRVDDEGHSADWLREGRVMAAITATATPLRGCDAIFLGRMRYLATASPGFVARYFPVGLTPEAMARAPVLLFDAKDRLQDRWVDAHVAPTDLPPPPRHVMPSSEAFQQGARHGLAWGLNPELSVRADLASGALVELRPDTPVDVALYWQVSRLMRPGLAPLTDSLRQVALARLLPAEAPRTTAPAP